VTPEALRDFSELIGVAKNNSLVDIGKFEYAIRGDLEKRSPRALAVLNPLPIQIENWPPGKLEELTIPWWPGEPERGGSRKVPFGGELLVERDDFAEDPPKDWKRLAPGREVRLAGAYLVRCLGVIRGEAGEVAALRCSYDAGSAPSDASGKRAAGTLHWVHAARSVAAQVRLFDRLFRVEQPDAEKNFLDALNPDSLAVARGARLEPALADAPPGTWYQFLRHGYFFADPVDSRPGAPIWNRTITLKDTWAAKGGAKPAADARKPREKKPATGPEAPATPRKSRAEFRAEERAADATLAAHYERYRTELGLSADEAALLAGERSTAAYFDAAVEAGAKPAPAARWLLNELTGLAAGASLDVLPLAGAAFGRFIALVDAGRLAPAAGKALLADLAAGGGEPEERMRALGLEKVEDHGAVEAAVAKALAAHAKEVERYRAGEKKLLGVLIGAAMRETQGAADAALVRRVLLQQLG
jgi:glutaminyl-tRNA synthetase